MQDFLHMGGVCSEAIESQNVVGYTTGATVSDNNFFTVPFSDIGVNTVDIQNIKLSDGGLGMIGYGTESFAIWEGVPTVVDGSAFVYWDPMFDPAAEATTYYWGDGDTQAKAVYSVAQGQGFVINCPANVTISTSGEVVKTNVSFTSGSDNNFTGNSFAASIDVQDITISDGGLGMIGYGTESFSIWEGVPTVVEGSALVYWDPMFDPAGKATSYYWGDGDTQAKATYEIPAGKGIVINCPAGLTVSIAAPYSL